VDLVERVGSYVGLAAFLGLAILALLYFSQARDVRRLREWAGRAPERASEGVAQPTDTMPLPAPQQHHLPALPYSDTPPPRKRLRDRARNVHIPSARYLAMTAAAVLLLGAGAFGAVRLMDDSGDDSGATTTTTNRKADRGGHKRSGSPSAAVDPANVTVAVLNGTTVQGLAARVSEEAKAGGFAGGTVGNAARIDQTNSTVLYRPGKAKAARAVANRLGVKTIGPVDSVNAEIAGSFDVLVLVGTDRSG
jgi:LytR cell envelope-related transcriptional attenuator